MEDAPASPNQGNSCDQPLKENQASSTVNEDDLDALLDDALEDFNKKPSSKKVAEETQAELPAPNSTKKDEYDVNQDSDPLFDAIWNNDAFLKMTDGLNDVMEQLTREDPNLKAEFQKFQEAMDSDISSSTDSGNQGPVNIDENVKKTLDELTKNLQGLNTDDIEPKFEDVFKQMQQGIGNDEDFMQNGDMFMGMMQGMMSNLLSKELLYPSLKEIRDNYPKWLTDNANKLTEDEYLKYTNQKDVVEKLCLIFEEEKEEDSDSVKTLRMDQIMVLMQEMQKYGHPPTDMMQNINGETMGAGALPSSECCVM